MQAFSGISAWSTDRLNLATGGEARFAEGLWVSGEFFDVLGVPPLLGRVFHAGDDRRGCGSPSVVIGYSFCQREFGGGPAAVGRKLTLEGHPFEILGVTPANFFGVEVGRVFDVALPLCSEPVIKGEQSRLGKRHAWWLATIGRLNPHWILARASAQLSSISPGIFEATVPPKFLADGVKNYLPISWERFQTASGFRACAASMLRRCGCCGGQRGWFF